MSTEQNLAVVRYFFDEIARQRLGALDEVCAPEFVVHFPGTPGPLTRETIRPFWEQFFDAFPDLDHRVEDMFAAGDRVVVRLTITGTHRGNFMGLPATGRAIAMGSINFLCCADGKIVEQWNNHDALGMLQQLGAIPTPPQAAA